jgi:hypothetical protein
MKAHWLYLKYVLRHKWFVLVAGLKTGAPLWRLLIHDWSKLTPAEWRGYVEHFYAPKPLVTYGDERNHRGTSPDEAERILTDRKAAFDRAWLHHQKRNPHHWQYWLLVPDRPDVVYHLESHDGGSTGNVLVGKSEHPRVEVYLPTLDINSPVPGADDRLRLVNRVLQLAARGGDPLEMPEPYVREMVADWMGAGRAITGKWEVRDWYRRNAHLIQLHPNTERRVSEILRAVSPEATDGKQ